MHTKKKKRKKQKNKKPLEKTKDKKKNKTQKTVTRANGGFRDTGMVWEWSVLIGSDMHRHAV